MNQDKSSGHGGPRKGAGRKAGAATKKTREIADKAAADGVTPLEVMLENMRFAHGEAGVLLAGLLDGGADKPDGFDSFKELLKFRGMAQEAAKDAAPYIHPKLSSVEMNAKVTTRSLDEELAELNEANPDAEGDPPLA